MILIRLRVDKEQNPDAALEINLILKKKCFHTFAKAQLIRLMPNACVQLKL